MWCRRGARATAKAIRLAPLIAATVKLIARPAIIIVHIRTVTGGIEPPNRSMSIFGGRAYNRRCPETRGR
jgi:hypothetical protein